MGKKDENHQKERGKSMYFSFLMPSFSVSYLWLALRVLIDNGIREGSYKKKKAGKY